MRAFLVLCDELHFGRAAARLGISQSTLSREIAVLERQFGCVLVDRRTHRLRLTDAGQHLRDGARRVVDNAYRLEEEMQAFNAVPAGHVRIAYAGSIGSAICPPLLRELLRELPHVSPVLHWSRPPAQYDALIAGEFEIGIQRQWQKVEVPNVDALTLFVERAVALVPSNDPLAKREVLTSADVRTRPLIAMPPSENPEIYKAVTSWVGAEAQHVAVGTVGRHDMVAAGVGVSIGFRSTLFDTVRVKAVALAPDPPTTSVIAIWRTPITSPVVRTLIEILTRLAATNAFQGSVVNER